MNAVSEFFPMVPLEDSFVLEYGASLPDQERTGTGFPVFGSNGVVGRHSHFLVKGPGIIVGRKGSLGKVCWSADPFWPIDTAYYVAPKRETDLRWLYWLLSNTNFKRLDSATGVPGLNRNDVYAVRAHKPSPAEQSRIATVLDITEEGITKTEAVIAKLRQVRTGLLQDLLTRGLDHNGQLRDPIAHPEQFKDSPLGRIPKEWTTPTLERLCSHIGSGVTPRGGHDVYTSTGIMLIRSQNVTFEGLQLEDVAFIPDEIHLGMLRSEVFAHDVLFNITGASIGRCCAMPEGLGTANVNQHVCALRVPKATAADAKYLVSVLASPIGQRQVDSLLTAGNRQGLNYQQLGSFVISWPVEYERKAINSQIIGIESQICSEEKAHRKLALLKSGLMTDLLAGRVRVPTGEE
jgi:type I restriction enzyme S subunit